MGGSLVTGAAVGTSPSTRMVGDVTGATLVTLIGAATGVSTGAAVPSTDGGSPVSILDGIMESTGASLGDDDGLAVGCFATMLTLGNEVLPGSTVSGGTIDMVGSLVTGAAVGTSPSTRMVGDADGSGELDGIEEAQKRWSL
jgi:hypothetical protein